MEQLNRQRSVPSSDTTEEDAGRLCLLEHQLAMRDSSVDTTLVARNVCMLQARFILSQIFTSDQLKKLKGDDDYDEDQLSIM